MTATATSQPQPDNLLGVCAAIGEDFGFNPLYLRVALGAGILWNPLAVLATYLGLGVLVLATRRLFPDRKPVADRPALEQPLAAPALPAANETVELAQAA